MSNVDNADAQGQTALWHAISDGDSDEATRLLALGADVEKAALAGTTPLYMAAVNDKPALIQLLVNHGADVNKAMDENTQASGQTPLFAAAQQNAAASIS